MAEQQMEALLAKMKENPICDQIREEEGLLQNIGILQLYEFITNQYQRKVEFHSTIINQLQVEITDALISRDQLKVTLEKIKFKAHQKQTAELIQKPTNEHQQLYRSQQKVKNLSSIIESHKNQTKIQLETITRLKDEIQNLNRCYCAQAEAKTFLIKQREETLQEILRLKDTIQTNQAEIIQKNMDLGEINKEIQRLQEILRSKDEDLEKMRGVYEERFHQMLEQQLYKVKESAQAIEQTQKRQYQKIESEREDLISELQKILLIKFEGDFGEWLQKVKVRSAQELKKSDDLRNGKANFLEVNRIRRIQATQTLKRHLKNA